MLKIQLWHHRNKLHIKIEKLVWIINISQYCVFNQIKAALVKIRFLLKTNLPISNKHILDHIQLTLCVKRSTNSDCEFCMQIILFHWLSERRNQVRGKKNKSTKKVCVHVAHILRYFKKGKKNFIFMVEINNTLFNFAIKYNTAK